MGAGEVHDPPGRALLLGQVAVLALVSFLISCFGAYSVVRTMVWSTKLHVKPFVCSICMGYWLGMALAFYFFKGCTILDSQFYALTAAGSNAIINKYVNGEN